MAIELNRANEKAVERLFPVLFSVRLNRDPFPWEILLGQALVFGELVIVNPPRDPGLRQIYYVAQDTEAVFYLHTVEDDAPESA